MMLSDLKNLRPWGRRGSRRRSALLLLAGALALGGCDLSVVNPSEIADSDLDDPTAIPGIIAGVIGDFGLGLIDEGGGGVYVAGAMLTDEMVNSGSWIGLRGLSNGESRDDWVESQLRWALPAKARWVANRAVERVSALVDAPDRNADVATALLYSGYANRVLGDNFCEATRDGGGWEPFTVWFEEAEEKFTEAIRVASNALADEEAITTGSQMNADQVLMAAYAGRAQVRMMLAGLNKDDDMWTKALQDAAMVPTNYVFNQRFSTQGDNLNRWYDWGYNTPTRETTVWGTPFVDWGQDLALPAAQRTGDARVQYEVMTGNFAKGRDARRPWYRQRKFTSQSAAIPNARGTEMRLIEAEAALVRGDWQGAVDKINEVRTFHNSTLSAANQLPMVTATNVDEAWELLMKERGIEMWLEGRRLPDLRRWEVTPGKDKVPFKVVRRPSGQPDPETDERVSVYAVERMCIEVSRNEKLANPNLR